jgi:hypothetical protein
VLASRRCRLSSLCLLARAPIVGRRAPLSTTVVKPPQAYQTASRLKTEGIDSARTNIAKLRELTGQIEQKVMGLPEKDEARSLEA